MTRAFDAAASCTSDAQRFRAALHVCLDEHGDDASLLLAHLREHVAHCGGLLRQLDVAELALTIQGHLARLALALDREDFVPCIGGAGKSEHQDGSRRQGFGDRGALLVEHRPDATEFLARDDRVAQLQGALLHQHGRHDAAALFHAGFDDEAGCEARHRCAQFEDFRLQEDGIEQLVNALAGQRRDVHEDVVAAPLLGDHLVLGELVPNLVGI